MREPPSISAAERVAVDLVNVTHLRKVVLGSPDPQDLARFYENVWGLRPVASVAETVFLRGSGDEHHILEIRKSARPSVIGYGVGLVDHEAVDKAAAGLRAIRGITVLSQPAPIGAPGGGYGFTISDVDGRRVELSAGVETAPTFESLNRVEPVKISHLVVNSPHAEHFTEMFVDVLGFRLADEMPHMMFLRCNSDHHSVAVARAPYPSLNHIAFELPTVDDMLSGVSLMRENGFEVIWGPGRHGPGNNTFGYFLAPNGQVIEYTSEVDQILDEADVAPRMWLPEEMRVNDTWADPTSARPTPHARELMLGDEEEGSGEPSVVAHDEAER
jgi:catechol-2,3-dioxygenase